MTRLCPMCGAPIVREEHAPEAHEPYQPVRMLICERGHRVTSARLAPVGEPADSEQAGEGS